MIRITAEDWGRILDWGIVLALFSAVTLWAAFVVGVAVLVFRLVGGV